MEIVGEGRYLPSSGRFGGVVCAVADIDDHGISGCCRTKGRREYQAPARLGKRRNGRGREGGPDLQWVCLPSFCQFQAVANAKLAGCGVDFLDRQGAGADPCPCPQIDRQTRKYNVGGHLAWVEALAVTYDGELAKPGSRSFAQ